ncbi:MAG: hypothetical protein RLZZ292_927 [Bacteroidota bacterium]|jgi:peroxiredoxin
MFNNSTLGLLFVAFFIFEGCGNDKPVATPTVTTTGIDYEARAKDICSCSTELVQLNKKLQQLKNAGDFEKMQDLISDLTDISEKQRDCIEQLNAKYPNVTDNDEQAFKALQTACPEMAALVQHQKERDANEEEQLKEKK